jgi:hypothetical protein
MRRKTKMTVGFLAAFALACSFGLGQTPSGPADKIEEDWQVVIASPDPDGVGPQLTTCMSPVADGSMPFVAFDLNYRDYSTFQPGGMQLNVYSGGSVMSSSSQGTALCQTANETISWTQRMHVSSSGNSITYRIVNGQSTTWGQFGSAQGLNPVSFAASITSLASYSPDTSVAKSGAGWESDHVASMTLLRVRYYLRGVLISTDSNPRSVTLSTANGQ